MAKVLADGVLVDVPDASLPPPSVALIAPITRLQGRLALNAAGLLSQVEAAVTQADPATQIWYADAQTWERDNLIIAGLATSMGLSSAQLDTLFQRAAAL